MYTSVDSSFKSKSLCSIVFKLNSDDFGPAQIRQITKYAKSLGHTVKKTRTYSPTKLMSWCNVTITTSELVKWEENDTKALEIINGAFNLK